MFQIVQKNLVLLLPTVNIPSNAVLKANLICNQSISKTSNSLTTLKMCLNHTRHYPLKSFLPPPSLIKSGVPYTNNNVQVLRVYNQLVSSCRQLGRDKIVKVRSAFTRNMNKGGLKPRRETLGKLVLMSSFLAPTMSFNNNNAQVEKKIPVIEITRKAKKNRSYLIQLFLEIYEAIRLCLRALRLVITFTPIFALYPITFLGEESKDLWWYLLLRGIEFSGPILIKLGQWASTRRDLFPDSCCRQFAKLQRSVKPHSWKYTKYMMRKAFGPDWRKIFVKFDNNRNPVGSGCVAQVYKVWMSAEAITDEEILTEILSEMEDDVSDSFEGMHVIGFRSLFGIDDEDVKQKRILEEWREKRDQMRREKEAQRRPGIGKEEQNVDLHEVVLEKEKKEMSKVDPENGEKHVKDDETGMIKGNKEFVVEASVDESGKELVEINTGIIKEDKQMSDNESAVVSRKEQSDIVSNREFENRAEKMKDIASDNQLVEKFYKEESNDTTSSFQSENDDSGKSDVDVLTVTENLAAELVNTEEDQQRQADLEPAEEPFEDITEHSLVEEWQEGMHDKSLPLEEGPPEDLDGLVPVAVKVLHPGIYSCFRRDLKIMKACASFISAIYPPLKWLSLPQCVQEFAEVMSCQIDLKLEAENMELFAENFADNPYVRFPRILQPYVTRKVLVETYEEGEQMIDFIGTTGEDKPAELKKRLAEIGVDALLKMVFVDNLVHGDLHPGNILVQNNSAKEEGSKATSGDLVKFMMVDVGCDTFVMHVEPDPNPLRICLLDCGVASRLKEKDLANFKAVFRQVVFGDGESVADLFLNNSEHCCKDPEAFKAEMTSLVNSAREDTIALSQIDVGVLLQQVLKILLHHQVRLESAFSAVVLAVFVLEGLGRALDPNMDILERARPILVTGKVK